MLKRAGVARAMALDPDILFFDEPSAGLDPISSRRLDDLILELRASLGATMVVVTHELPSIFAIADRAVFLDAETRTMIALGNPKTLRDESPEAEGAGVPHTRRAERGRICRMSMRANPAVIGAFVVGAVVLLLVALLVWGGTGLFRTKLDYVLFFDSAVTGLNKGAPVLARGVKVGEVTDVQLRWGTPLIAVYIALEPEAVKGTAKGGPAQAIERAVREDGLRAQLRMQSFVTGVLYVALDVRPDTPIVLRGLDPQVPELPTIPTDIEVWTAKLERFADKIEKVPLDHIGQTTAAILDGGQDDRRRPRTPSDLFRNANAAHRRRPDARRQVDAQIDPLLAEVKGTLARLDAGPGRGPEAGRSTSTAASTRWPPRPRPRSRRRRGRSATPGLSSRICAASRPRSMPRPIRC